MDENKIFIGNKSLIKYTNAVAMQFHKGAVELFVLARGKYIGRAVDVVEILKRSKNILVKSISISTQEMEMNGKKLKVSSIEIIITENKNAKKD